MAPSATTLRRVTTAGNDRERRDSRGSVVAELGFDIAVNKDSSRSRAMVRSLLEQEAHLAGHGAGYLECGGQISETV